MKFYGEPNMLVNKRQRKKMSTKFELKPIFRFDENGEYVTEDESLINRLSPHFRHDEQRVKLCCKKCDFVTDNKGILMQHHKKEHPKEATQ